MQKLTNEQVQEKAGKRGLAPVRVMDTDIIKIVSVDTAKASKRFVEICWPEFFTLLGKKNLAVFDDAGYIVIRREQ
jgi:hypothetical protein